MKNKILIDKAGITVERLKAYIKNLPDDMVILDFEYIDNNAKPIPENINSPAKNIFIICGAHNGNIALKLDNTKFHNPDGNQIVWDEIHLFEPNPNYEDILKDMQKSDHRYIFHNKALRIKNSKENFYISADHNQYGSTLDRYKFSGGEGGTVIKVDVIDFVDWLRNNTSEQDNIGIDMDIEGQEFEILPKIIERNIYERIKFLIVEFHTGKSFKWQKDNKDKIIENQIKQFFKDRLSIHDKIFG